MSNSSTDSDNLLWFLAGAGTALGLTALVLSTGLIQAGGPMLTEFVRDEQGRIVEIVERPMK